MTGLNLLHLLADNRIAEFHTELELIPQQVCSSEPKAALSYARLRSIDRNHLHCVKIFKNKSKLKTKRMLYRKSGI